MSENGIYVADLAAYNNGILHGVWIDATQDEICIQAETTKMLRTSPIKGAEEWAIHDYEGFDGVQIGEYEGFKSIQKKAELIEDHGRLGALVLAHWCGDIDDALSALGDSYFGQYESLADYVQQLTEETSEVPQHLVHYIDYELMARDLEINGDLYAIETARNEVHIFWCH